MGPWSKEIGGDGATPGLLLRWLCWASYRCFQKKPLTRNKGIPETMGGIYLEEVHTILYVDPFRRIVTQATPFFRASLIDSGFFANVSQCWISHQLLDAAKGAWSTPVFPNTYLLPVSYVTPLNYTTHSLPMKLTVNNGHLSSMFSSFPTSWDDKILGDWERLGSNPTGLG